MHEKLSGATVLVHKASEYLSKTNDSKAKEIISALNALKLEDLEVDIYSTKLALQEELSKLREAIEHGGVLPSSAAGKPVAAAAAAPAATPAPATNAAPANQEAIKALEADNAKLRDLLRDAQKELSAANNNKASASNEESKKLKTDIDNLNDQIKRLNIQCKDKDQEIARFTSQLDDLKKSSSNEKVFQSEIERLQKTIASLEKDKVTIQKDADTKLATKTKEIQAAADKKVAEKEKTWSTEKDELETAMAQEIEEIEKSKEQDQKKYTAEINDLKKKVDSMQKVNKTLAASLKKLASMAKELKSEQQDCLQVTKRDMKDYGTSIKTYLSSTIITRLQTVNEEMKVINGKYRKEMLERKRLHNLVQELKGNIRVFMRCRPPTNKELEQFGNDAFCVSFPNQGEVKVFNEKNREKVWEFDEVFDVNTSQEQVYEDVAALVVSVLDGYNVCIFAYGQTGSGKTFTMSGPASNRGVNTRALEDLFVKTKERREEWRDTIAVSLLEVYNEQIRDLLSDNKSEEKLDVKMGEFGNYVPGLTQVNVDSIEAVMRLITLADRNRSSSTTNMNEHSSRSHMILTCYITSEFIPTGVISRGKLNLVDLAGSERIDKSGAQGQALKEAQNINKSLSALGDVIAARAQKQSHVPFRNSTLTYLLQDSLSQDSKTLMIVCVSPVLYNAEETFCSLNFAAR